MKWLLPGYVLVALVTLVGCVGVQTVEYVPVSTETAVSPNPTLEDMGEEETMSLTAVPPTLIPESADETVSKANADVLFVRAVQTDQEKWTFYVTVEHPDTGWEDYADGWDVALPGGRITKPDPYNQFTRVLLHPHVDEQPFTRSQSAIFIPQNVTEVTVRAHDLVDGFGGQEVVVDLTAVSGPNFEVER